MDGTLGVLQTALALRALRHQLIAANLANVETPGYARRDVRFDAVLAEALGRRRLPLSVRDPRHLAGSAAGGSTPAVYAEPTAVRPDGNGVDVERELAELARNAVEYAVLSRLAGDALGRLRAAVEGR